MISVNPSKTNLGHIGRKFPERHKKYISINRHRAETLRGSLEGLYPESMDEYAKNFQPGINSRKPLFILERLKHTGITEETQRRWKGDYIKPEIKKEDWPQTHVHVVVSRMGRVKEDPLKPMANAKNSKNIINGKEVRSASIEWNLLQSCEKKLWLQIFDYKRSQQHKFSHYHTMKNQMRNTGKKTLLWA